MQEPTVVWLCFRVAYSSSALFCSERCFFANVCMSALLWWCHKAYGGMPTGKPAVCLESKESKRVMIVFRTWQYEAEEDECSSAELQNYRILVTVQSGSDLFQILPKSSFYPNSDGMHSLASNILELIPLDPA